VLQRSGPIAPILGILLIVIGLILLGAIAWGYLSPPMEEPASPGKTPNPSRLPSDEAFERTLRWTGRLVLFMRYGAIPTALLLIGAGVFLLVPDRPVRGG
jgi:hypothetical protein